MIEGLIGRKVGMTQIFTDDGNVVPVTVVKAGPCLIVQKKGENEKDLNKVQLCSYDLPVRNCCSRSSRSFFLAFSRLAGLP